MFEGSGCAISMASASLMSEFLVGKTTAAVEEIFTLFHQLMLDGNHKNIEKLDKLAVLGGVFEYPARVKCATLAWHTLKGALDNDIGVVSTENT